MPARRWVFNFQELSDEFDLIHSQTQNRLKAAGDSEWEKGAPFGANVIHGTGSYKQQLAEILKARERGVPINVVSIAFSQISPAAWEEDYLPLLKAGIALMPLGENERRWDHFMENIYPDIPREYQDLLAIAPEGAEGGGHNVAADRPTIRYGHQLTKELLKREAEGNAMPYPWFMTGGQTTPLALADAMLVQGRQSVRGGMQIGGAMQLAKESTPPEQVKKFIAEAAKGDRDFVQVVSEFDRNINVVENAFSRDFVAISDILADVPKRTETVKNADDEDESVTIQDPIGRERAEKIADIMLHHPREQLKVLERLWVKGMNDFNRAELGPLLENVWPRWLEGDRDALITAIEDLTPKAIIATYKTYRTWSLMESDVDPDWAYVLGGKSIRALGRALEAEGRSVEDYLMKTAPEIFEDLRDRTLAYMTDLYQRATALEEAAKADYQVSTPNEWQAIEGVGVVSEEDLSEGEVSTVRVKIGKDLDQEAWTHALLSAGHGSLAEVLRAEDVGAGKKEGNPLRRALLAETGDEIGSPAASGRG